MESCRNREAELLEFTQKLTEKNVRLQSEFTAVEAKAHQLEIEHSSCTVIFIQVLFQFTFNLLFKSRIIFFFFYGTHYILYNHTLDWLYFYTFNLLVLSSKLIVRVFL